MRAYQYFQGFKCKNPAITSSVSQLGKQGLAFSLRDHLTSPVIAVKGTNNADLNISLNVRVHVKTIP